MDPGFGNRCAAIRTAKAYIALNLRRFGLIGVYSRVLGIRQATHAIPTE